jgi:hypothetical protein
MSLVLVVMQCGKELFFLKTRKGTFCIKTKVNDGYNPEINTDGFVRFLFCL